MDGEVQGLVYALADGVEALADNVETVIDGDELIAEFGIHELGDVSI